MSSLTATTNLPILQASLQLIQATGGTVTEPSGGTPVAWAIPAGTYDTLQDVVTAFVAALTAAIAGSWGGSVDSYGADGVTIGHGSSSFDLTINPGLASFLSLPETSSAVSSVSSTATPPCVWAPSLPLTGQVVTYNHYRSQAYTSYGVPVGSGTADTTDFQCVLHFTSTTVVTLRAFLELVSRGIPFRLWQRRSETDAYAEDNRTGYLDLVLLTRDIQESWDNLPYGTYGTYTLNAAVV